MRGGSKSIKFDSKYNRFFGKANRNTIIRHKKGDVHDTIKTIVYVSEKYNSQTKQIAQKLTGNSILSTAENIYNFCYSYFQYKEDGFGVDSVRTPNRAWYDRKDGIDCDCFSALISCMLKNLGLSHTIRMSANFQANSFNHVYIILPDERGNEICIDPVVDKFNQEHDYLTKSDTKMEIQVLNGVNLPNSKPSRESIISYYNSYKPIVGWIINHELRADSRIRKAIGQYARRNNFNTESAENIIANVLFMADKKRWYDLARSNRIIKRSNRNYTIREKDILIYLGLGNSNIGLLGMLLFDAKIMELWLETTNNLEFATQIVQDIMRFTENQKTIRKHIPFKQISKFAKSSNFKDYHTCYCPTEQANDLIHNQDPISNFLQLSIVVNTAERGNMIKTVKRMYKPDGSKESNRLHSKLTRVHVAKRNVDQIKPQSQPLNGWITALGTAAGAAFGAPQVGALVGGTVESLTADTGGGGSGYVGGQTYVWPDGKAYNRSNSKSVNMSIYTKRMDEFAKKPYSDAVILKYNEIKAQKGNVDPTQSEYLQHISPIIKGYEKKITQQKQQQVQQLQARQAEVQIRKAQEDKTKKNNDIIKYTALGVGGVGLLFVAYKLVK